MPQEQGTVINHVFAKSTKIGVAHIKCAMIVDAQVDTLKIAGNAVTLPLYLSGYGGVSGITPGQIIQVGAVVGSYPDSAGVVALVSWQAINLGIDTNTRIEVRVDGWTFLAASDSAVKEMALSDTTSSGCAYLYGACWQRLASRCVELG